MGYIRADRIRAVTSPLGQSRTSSSSRMSGSQPGRPGSRLLRGPRLRHGSRPWFQLRFRLWFLRVHSLRCGCLGFPSLSLFSSSFSRPGFTIRNLLWTPANSIKGDKDRSILGFVYQTDTGIGGCQFKDPIGAVERSGKFPSLALNIPGHVHKHSITKSFSLAPLS